MKKFLTIAAFIMAAYAAEAQILWKITGNGLESPSYILGTHHLAPLSVLDGVEGFKAAYDSVDKVCGELVMSEMQKPETIMMLQKEMVMPDGKTLDSLYSEEEMARVSSLFKELTGIDLSMAAQLKPAAVMQQIVLLLNMKHIEGFNPNDQLDTFVQDKALEDGKKVLALETIRQQIDILYNAPLEEQAEDLLYVVDHIDESVSDVRELSEIYMSYDIGKLLECMEEQNAKSGCDEEELDRLLYDRNVAWAEKMPQMMKEGPVMFVVGAGHLPGERGVLELLERQGYELTPVK